MIARLERAAYYTLEHYGLGLLELLGGPPPRMELRAVRLLPVGRVSPRLLEAVEARLEEEFGLATVREPGRGEGELLLRNGLFVPRALRWLSKRRRRSGDALLVVTPRPIALLPPSAASDLLRNLFLLLGLAVPAQGVAFVTTGGGRLPPARVAETAAHEVAHLKGIHGWPMYRHGCPSRVSG